MWKVVYSRQAQKDAQKIAQSGLRPRVEAILDIIVKKPYDSAYHFERLRGDYAGFYSRRSTIKHRLVYEVYDEIKVVRVVRMWTHYE